MNSKGTPQNLRAPWKPGQSGNPKGKPKNRVPQQMVDVLMLKSRKELTQSLTREEVDEWEQRILSCSRDELQIIAQNASLPIYASSLARAIILDFKNGKTTTLDKLRDRVYGKAPERMELTGANGEALVPAQRLTEEQAAQLMKKLEEEY